MAKIGRPSNYTPELGELFCERHAAGESVTAICADPTMPKTTTIGQWRAAHPDFATMYAHARELAALAEADLAKAYSNQTHVELPNGMWVPLDVQRSRLMADTAKWRAGKLAPKDYGDRLAVEHSGSISFSDKSDEDLIDMLREMLATGRVSLPDGGVLVDDDEEPPEDNSDLA